MKKSKLITAFLSVATMVSMLTATASAAYVRDGDTPVFDISPTVEGYVKDGSYYDNNGKIVKNRQVLYIDYSNKNEIGTDLRMMKVDTKSGKLSGTYTGFVKNSTGRRYYNDGRRVYGWYKVGNNWYHFDEKGYADTGRTKICNSYYTFDSKGRWNGKVSKDGLAPKDFTLLIENINGINSFDTKGNIFYGMDMFKDKYVNKIKFSAKDRQIMYCMFLESGLAKGESTEYDFAYINRRVQTYTRNSDRDIMVRETSPTMGYKITVSCGGKKTELSFDFDCQQLIHIDEDCFLAYTFTKNLADYRDNFLYKSYPKPDGVKWVGIE